MNQGKFWCLAGVSDGQLQEGLNELLAKDARTEARIVAHLAEVDARRLHLLRGPSLFVYCQACLGFSESEAWYRICAARMGRRFPLVFELLETREIHLTAVALIAKYLTVENHRELLTSVRGKTKRQILELLARRFPKADVVSHLRKIPAGTVAAGPTGLLEPLREDAYCLQLKISGQLAAKLELARDLMSHANPGGDLAVVVEHGVDVLIEKLRAKRFGRTKRPRGVAAPSRMMADGRAQLGGEAQVDDRATTGVSSASAHRRQRRHVTHDVRRQVVQRDGESCTYVGCDGRRCGARAFLQLHHEHAWAKGGADSPENLRLLCWAHNRLLAEQELGAEAVQRVIELRKGAG